MSTTTIRLPEELKARIARIAEGAGTTPHNLMLHAIRERVEIEEERAGLHRVAAERLAEFERTGEAIAFDDAMRYLRELAAGRKPPRPRARKVLPRG